MAGFGAGFGAGLVRPPPRFNVKRAAADLPVGVTVLLADWYPDLLTLTLVRS